MLLDEPRIILTDYKTIEKDLNLDDEEEDKDEEEEEEDEEEEDSPPVSEEEVVEEIEEPTTSTAPPKRKIGRPRKGEVVIRPPLKKMKKGPSLAEEDYKRSTQYINKKAPKKTTICRPRARRPAIHNCMVCNEVVVTSAIVKHLSAVHCFPQKLRYYLLDAGRIKRQQAGKPNVEIRDCLTCFRRFVNTRAHPHHGPRCEVVPVKDFMSLDGLCLRARASMAVLDGDLRRGYELLKEEFERD